MLPALQGMTSQGCLRRWYAPAIVPESTVVYVTHLRSRPCKWDTCHCRRCAMVAWTSSIGAQSATRSSLSSIRCTRCGRISLPRAEDRVC